MLPDDRRQPAQAQEALQGPSPGPGAEVARVRRRAREMHLLKFQGISAKKRSTRAVGIAGRGQMQRATSQDKGSIMSLK